MTDFRDPNYRDPNSPVYRDPMGANPRTPNLAPDDQPWSMATWGWIGGIALVVLILVVMFSSADSNRTADQQANPPVTTGQRNTLPAPTTPSTDAPTMNRPAPAPMAPSTPPVSRP